MESALIITDFSEFYFFTIGSAGEMTPFHPLWDQRACVWIGQLACPSAIPSDHPVTPLAGAKPSAVYTGVNIFALHGGQWKQFYAIWLGNLRTLVMCSRGFLRTLGLYGGIKLEKSPREIRLSGAGDLESVGRLCRQSVCLVSLFVGDSQAHTRTHFVSKTLQSSASALSFACIRECEKSRNKTAF